MNSDELPIAMRTHEIKVACAKVMQGATLPPWSDLTKAHQDQEIAKVKQIEAEMACAEKIDT